MELQLGGVIVVPLIVGLVQVAKGLGLPTAWAAPLAALLGLAVRASYELALVSGRASWADAGLEGVALGLAAAGLYSAGKKLGQDSASGGGSLRARDCG